MIWQIGENIEIFKNLAINLDIELKSDGFHKFMIRIFGGNETKIDEYPWMALLQYSKRKMRIWRIC